MSKTPCGCHKRRFLTWDKAMAAAIRVSRHVGPMRIYECPNMPGYHLTTRRVWKEGVSRERSDAAPRPRSQVRVCPS